jgi:hypothetical protein
VASHNSVGIAGDDAIEASDETVEMELSAEELRGLSQAAEAALLPTPGTALVIVRSAPTRHKERAVERIRRWPWTRIAEWAGATATYGAFAAFAWWGVMTVGNQQSSPVAAAIVKAVAQTAAAATPELPVKAPNPTVQVKNPFDKSEVFEFPAGTSEVEAREKVAEMLLQRARDRQNEWANIRPSLSLRTASLYRSR